MKYYAILFFSFALLSCKNEPLPDYGEVKLPGEYVNQLGETISQSDVEGEVVVADFIFTHCPSICIPMAGQMKRVHDTYEGKDDVRIMSFSIDPERDTIERLKWYGDKIGAKEENWWFLRADMSLITETSKEFRVFQSQDADAPGGFNHQSWFVLIDKEGHWRGSYDGTNTEDVDQLIKDMKQLL